MSNRENGWRSAPTDGSVVYFILTGKHVKIGTTTNLSNRLAQFRTCMTEPDVLLTIPGDRHLELRLHDLLSECRVAREIFRLEWRLQSFLEQVRYFNLERAIEFLVETQPSRRVQKRIEEREKRVAARRQSKAELDAYYAGLVSDRKRRLGW